MLLLTERVTKREWEIESDGERETEAGGVYQSLKGQASELIRFGREKLLRLSLRTDRV